jgi:hypothetical protein
MTPKCKDCGSTTRKLSRPGPRCATCHREVKKANRERAHDRYVERKYGISGDRYRQIRAVQAEVCALCEIATGATKYLAVDHDHACCPGPVSCGKCVRGVLCGPCNDVLALAGDRVAYFVRCIAYLNDPPAGRV